MKKISIALLLTVAALPAFAWDIALKLELLNAGNRPASVTSYVVSLDPGDGGPVYFWTNSPANPALPPGGELPLLADLAWPLTTPPATGSVAVFWTAGNTNSVTQGGALSWPGGSSTTLTLAGLITLAPLAFVGGGSTSVLVTNYVANEITVADIQAGVTAGVASVLANPDYATAFDAGLGVGAAIAAALFGWSMLKAVIGGGGNYES